MPSLPIPLARSLAALGGSGLFARALRGAAVAAGGFVAAQVLRLGSNLILTRILYPEAFGLLALVTVFLVGLAMFSDVGIGTSIQQNPRGDETDFLDTAWTVQVIRGGLLWLATCALAWPAAQFYRAPELAWLLPVSGLGLLIAGFSPTRVETVHRHLRLGRITALELLAQAAGIAVMIGLALVFRSVWALVAGSVIQSAIRLAMLQLFLPGARNRFRWEPAAAAELIRFGKWIFLSTMLGFLVTQGDRAILGRYLSLEILGIYAIGSMLAAFPGMLAGTVVGRVYLPLYREVQADNSALTRRRLRRLRAGTTAAVMVFAMILAWGGGPIVGLLYDDRYALAGAVVTGLALAYTAQVAAMTYDAAALAAGDSRGYFALSAVRALVLLGGFVAGLEAGGLAAAFLGQGLGALAVHGAAVMLARKHRVWDPLHDLVTFAVAAVLGAGALWWNRALLGALWQVGTG